MEMLDLNMSFVHEDDRMSFRGEMDESATSNSSVINAEGCNSSNAGDGDDDSISVARDGDAFRCFNFDILKVGDTAALPSNSNSNSNSNDEDRMSETQTRSEFVTRTLFPVSHGDGGGGGRLNQGHQVNSLLLFPNNNELQDTRMIQVPQQKPTVQQNQVGKKSRRGPRSRSSQYRGVTFYRRTGRWESHIWDCGKQVYLGGFDTAHSAARAYDRAAIKFRGVDADINFNLSDYEDDMNQQIKNLSKEDFVHILRRHSNGFSRGNSKYRGGVTMQKCGGLEAQMVEFLGKKAHVKAAIKINGREAVTNFEANACEGETVASHRGSDHNLDLNLGISTPSCLGKGSSRNENLQHMQLNHDFHDIRRLQAENPATMALRGLPVISENGQSWTGMYPNLVPSYEVGATNSRFVGGGSSQGPSNWAWQFHGQSYPPNTLFTAASSGFPSPMAPPNSHHHPYQTRPRPSPPPAPPPTR